MHSYELKLWPKLSLICANVTDNKTKLFFQTPVQVYVRHPTLNNSQLVTDMREENVQRRLTVPAGSGALLILTPRALFKLSNEAR